MTFVSETVVCVCVCVCEREREREGETEWDREHVRVCVNDRQAQCNMVSTLIRMHFGTPFIFFTLGYYFTN